MKEARRTDVERFLRQQGYRIGRDSGRHTWWVKPGCPAVPLPRHARISPGVLRSIEKAVGQLPDEWR
ncbi:MAG: type II toxin-antitoxin system HicA family toxin [Actinobacteria bacterium]|nr:type II toxin-antitoxin system HicA family toxin [Actinomycetota bacterium]